MKRPNSIIRAITRLIASSRGLSTCVFCERGWSYEVSGHSVSFEEGRGCFWLCKECWAGMTPNERLYWYDITAMRPYMSHFRARRQIIADIVLGEKQ